MNSHELANLLLAGPDLQVQLNMTDSNKRAYTRADIKVQVPEDMRFVAENGHIWDIPGQQIIKISGLISPDDKQASWGKEKAV